MKIKSNININSTVENIFSYLEDEKKQKLWIKDLIKVEKENIADPMSNFTIHLKEGSKINAYKGYTKSYNKPTNLTVIMENDKFKVETSYLLLQQTNLSVNLYFETNLTLNSSIAKFFMSLFNILFKIMLKKQLKVLKKLAEENAIQ